MQNSGILDISRLRVVHLQGIQGRSRSTLLRVLDNEANGRFVSARRVNIFEVLISSYIIIYKAPSKIFM